MENQNKTNWVAILFWGVIIGVICLTFLWQKDNISNFIQNPQLPEISTITNNLTVDGVIEFANKYGSLIGIGATAVTTVYGFYMKHKANVAQIAQIDAEEAATKVELEAQSKINTAQSIADDYKLKYESAIKNNGLEALQEAQSLVSQKENTIKSLQEQLHYAEQKLEAEIQKRPVITKTEVK